MGTLAKVFGFFAVIVIISIAVYVFALINKRKSDYNGIMSYKQGVMAGIIITIFVIL